MQELSVSRAIGLSLLTISLVLLLLLGSACTQQTDTPTTSSQPTAAGTLPSPNPTLSPTTLPPASPTPTTRPRGPSTWTVRMVTDTATGALVGVVDDPRVYQMVEDDYLEGERWFFAQALTLTQVNAPTELLAEYFTGQRLPEMEGLVNLFRSKGQTYRTKLRDRHIEVKNFSADGHQVYLEDSWGGGQQQWYSLSTGEVVEEKELPAGMVIITMLYDEEHGRWRSAAAQPVETTSP